MMAHRVFVYGTLKRGHRNHHFLSVDSVRFIGAARTARPEFLMHAFASITSQGQFTPGVFKGGSATIDGEVYEIGDDILARLDALEGLGVKYDREEIMLSDGIAAFIYLEREGMRTPVPDCRYLAYDPQTNIYSWML